MSGIVNPWERVRNHWVANIDAELGRLRPESKVIKEGPEWSSAICPCCSDKDGSASIASRTGYLNCRQCGVKGSLFDWLGSKLGLDPLHAMLAVGERYGLKLEKKAKKGKGSVHCDIETQLELAIVDLWQAPEAEPLRSEVQKRGFNALHFAPYSIGWFRDHLVFPQFGPTGEPDPRYHAWLGPHGKPKWRWGGAAKLGPVNHGLWPCLPPPPNAEVILLCAGEWDTLTARERWKLQEQGIYAYTWTGGETTPLRPGLMPAWLKGKEVRVCYDFDVWQGPDLGTYQAPSPKHLDDLVRRRKNLIEGVCWPVSQLGCRVGIYAVPNPKGEFNADLRDYYDFAVGAGQQPTLDAFQLTPFADISPANEPARKCTFEEAIVAECGKTLRFEASVSFICEDTEMPVTTRVECDAGSYQFCAQCNLLREFPDKIIRWDQYPLGLARFLSAGKSRESVIHQLIGKPGQCHAVQLHSENQGVASRWVASDPESLGRHEMTIVSPRVPDFGDEVVIEGAKWTRTDSVTPVFLARSLAVPEREKESISPYIEALHSLCPWETVDPDDLWNHIYYKRHDDLAAWATGIFGRQNYHIAVDLVAHSALWWIDDAGKRQRGWIDANITGSTRSGKSVTARALIDHYKIGAALLSMQGLWSFAGLIASNESIDNTFRVRPGIVPKFHGRMLVLDELQHTVNQDKLKLMPMLQEMRDTGSVYIAKMASRRINCAVRLLTLANPPSMKGRGFDHYRHACEALIPLYSSPESLARTDFCVTYDDHESIGFVSRGVMQSSTPHQFTSELCHVLVRRAWDMRPEDVHVEKEAFDEAVSLVNQWAEVYDTRLPLFTGPEKVSSLIRIAISVANMTFSHPPGDYGLCLVRKAHVIWAGSWLEGLWDASGYLTFSAAKKKQRITQPWIAEYQLLAIAGPDPEQAKAFFGWMVEPHQKSAIQSYHGGRLEDVDRLISQLLRSGVLEILDETSTPRYGTTSEGGRLLRRLIYFVEMEPGRYRTRFERYSTWWSQANHTEGPTNVEPLQDPGEPGS